MTAVVQHGSVGAAIRKQALSNQNEYQMREPPVLRLSARAVEFLRGEGEISQWDGETFWRGWRVVTT